MAQLEYTGQLRHSSFDVEMTIPLAAFERLVPLMRADPYDVSDDELAFAGRAVPKALHRKCTVYIDAQATTGTLQTIEAVEKDTQLLVKLKLSYALSTQPRQLLIRWAPAGLGDEAATMRGTIVVAGQSAELKLDHQVTDFVWQKPVSTLHLDDEQVDVRHEPKPVHFPVVSAILAGVALVVLVYGCRRPGALVVSLLVALGLGGTGWVTRHVGNWAFQHPTALVPAPLSAAEATEQFQVLHQRIYWAFDYVDENDRYEVLAGSLVGALLERVYIETQSALESQDERGIVFVHGVEYVACEPSHVHVKDDVVHYSVTCKYRVRGTLTHRGHQHVRHNEYEGRYTLSGTDDRWRISEATITAQRQLEQDTPE